MENDLLLELWSRIKPLIPQKDRLDAADKIVAVFDEHGMIVDTADISVDFDKELKAAFVSVYGIEEEEDDDDDDEWG